MNSPSFSVVIPIKDIDTPHFIHTLSYLKHFTNAQDIVILTAMENAKMSHQFENLQKIGNVVWIDEKDIYQGMNLESINAKMRGLGANSTSRAGWYLQQFLKMAFALYVLKNANSAKFLTGGGIRYYLIWDSDTIPLRKLKFFKQGKVIFEKANEYHKPYFDTLANLQLPIGETQYIHKAVDFSFVTENMMIEIAKMQELIELIESTRKKPFWEAILEHINPHDLTHSGFSEFETYGNFIALAYPNTFHITQRKRDRYAKEFIGKNPSIELLQWYSRSYEVIGLESWSKENIRISTLLQNPLVRILPPKVFKKLLRFYIKLKRL